MSAKSWKREFGFGGSVHHSTITIFLVDYAMYEDITIQTFFHYLFHKAYFHTKRTVQLKDILLWVTGIHIQPKHKYLKKLGVINNGFVI